MTFASFGHRRLQGLADGVSELHLSAVELECDLLITLHRAGTAHSGAVPMPERQRRVRQRLLFPDSPYH